MSLCCWCVLVVQGKVVVSSKGVLRTAPPHVLVLVMQPIPAILLAKSELAPHVPSVGYHRGWFLHLTSNIGRFYSYKLFIYYLFIVRLENQWDCLALQLETMPHVWKLVLLSSLAPCHLDPGKPFLQTRFQFWGQRFHYIKKITWMVGVCGISPAWMK